MNYAGKEGVWKAEGGSDYPDLKAVTVGRGSSNNLGGATQVCNNLYWRI